MKAWLMHSSSLKGCPLPWCLLPIMRLMKLPGCTPRARLRASAAFALIAIGSGVAAAFFSPAVSRTF